MVTKRTPKKIVDAAPLFEQAASEPGKHESRPLTPTEYQAEGWKPDDDEIALALKPELENKVAYFYSDWRVYQGGCWTRRTGADVRKYIRQELRSWRKRGVGVSQHKIKSLASMLEDDLAISDMDLMDTQDEQRRYVNLRNGLFNLETLQLEEHRPELYFTTQLDFDYDADAQCPNFHKYLNSSLVLPDSKETDVSLKMLVLEALGYSMTARTDLKASFWLVGEKDSGKSTFIALIKALMGNLHTTIDLNQLGTNRFLLAGIVGKRVVTFTESGSNTYLNDAQYKTLVGGSDEVYADVKNRDGISFRPECKVWWAMNEMPRINDRSGATTRRIHIIPFNRSIPENERVGNLEQLLWSERSGIFNEMVAYYIRLTNMKTFEHCAQSEQRRQAYILDNDTEATYVLERCEQHSSYKAKSGELFNDYKEWCLTNGFHHKNHINIANEWRRLGFKDRTLHGMTVWDGVKLREQKF